jgi:two-component system KDP operon response regulator KdpE
MAGKRILIVEDDGAMRKVLHAQLRTAGYDAFPVADAVVAFAEIRKQPPDLILLDLGLPGGGGLNLMQRLQSIPKYGVIPIVVVSAQPRSTGIEAEVIDKGAAAFFEKPVPADTLLQKIRDLIG